LHPKVAEMGSRKQFMSRNVYIERDDAKTIEVG